MIPMPCKFDHPAQSPKTMAGQKGVALIVALILLIVTTLIALSASRFTTLGVAQSGNYETVREAQQSAQSIVDGVIANPSTLVVGAAAPYVQCTPTPGTSCDDNSLTLASGIFSAEVAAGRVAGSSSRLLPLLRPLPRSRGASSLTKFQGASFRIRGSIDETDQRRSRATIERGYLVPVSTGS